MLRVAWFKPLIMLLMWHKIENWGGILTMAQPLNTHCAMIINSPAQTFVVVIVSVPKQSMLYWLNRVINDYWES